MGLMFIICQVQIRRRQSKPILAVIGWMISTDMRIKHLFAGWEDKRRAANADLVPAADPPVRKVRTWATAVSTGRERVYE